MFLAYPTMLWLLLVPLTLAYFEWARKGQPVVMPVDHGRAKRGYVLLFLVQTANMLPALLLAAAIILLARPMVHTPPQAERLASNVYFVLDISASMSDPFGPQPPGGPRVRRFDAAMDAIDKFTTYRAGDTFGLTIYARYFLHWVPLTPNSSAIRFAREFVQPWDYAKGARGEWQPGFSGWVFGGTATLAALKGVVEMLKETTKGDRTIILITDGFADDDDDARRAALLDDFHRERITCFGVFINDGGTPPNIERLCSDSGGAFFTVDDILGREGLQTVFKHIDEMKKTRIVVSDPGAVDHRGPLVTLALILLGMHLLALLGLRFTPW
jgi:Ca-activated chloride channel family protein